MDIVTFHVSADHMVTIDMQRMPITAKRDNTTIDIGGIAQAAPDLVSFREQKIEFSAGAADQQGPITVTVADRTPLTATSAEPYVTLHEDAEIAEKVAIRSVYPAKAKVGDPVSIRGRCFGGLQDLYVGFVKVPNFTHTETSARFTVPNGVRAGTFPIRFKDRSFSGGAENSTVRLEITDGGGEG